MSHPRITVQGGVLAEHYRGSLQINVVWVSEAFRRQGYGTAMLAAVEAEAVKVFARLGGYANGESRYYLRKTLASPAATGARR